jgi:alcohol dehydrogenase
LRIKAAVLRSFQSPFSLEHVDLPEPPEGWVTLRVRAVGVCGRDVVVWRGGFGNLKPPLILGHEVYGVYDGRPYGVYPAVPKCASGGCDLGILGEDAPGGYAEAVNVPRSSLVPLPDSRFEVYAAAVCGVATFIHASRVAGVSRGDRVLVTGASGGVGVHGSQYLARVVGAEVLGFTRSREKARVLEELGVTPVTDPSFYRSLGRVDYVFETVGSATINWSLRALKPGGTLVLIGNVEGRPITIERPALVFMRQLRIQGSSVYTREEYEEAVKLVAEGVVRPLYRAYRLEEINRAYDDVVNGRLVGRAVLVVG